MAARKNAKGKRAPAKGKARPKAKARAARPAIDVPSGWTLDRGGKSMSRRVRTKDFLEAVGLIDEIAPVAEELEHHPDLHLEQWNRLRITTWSHDVGGLTSRDARLAARVDELLRKRGFA